MTDRGTGRRDLGVLLGLAAVGVGLAVWQGTVVGGSEPTTRRALAFVAAEHAGTPDTATKWQGADSEPGELGVTLLYVTDPPVSGDHLDVSVSRDPEERSYDCGSAANDVYDGCVATSEGVVKWQTEEPEEDPGIIIVRVDKGDTEAVVVYSGPSITGDPRELELPVSVDTMVDIANDPRVDLTTSQDAVDRGRALDYWNKDLNVLD